MGYSVITPVYNREDSVAACIESVISNLQWGIDIEHVIVDDGSHDSSPKIIKEYASKYPHIHFIQFNENRGTNAARNAAIKAATKEHCIFLDSDDYFLSTAIRDINNAVKSHPSHQYFLFHNDDFETLHKGKPFVDAQETEFHYNQFLLGEISGDFVHCIPTDILKKYPFDENVRIYEGIFFLRIFRKVQRLLLTRCVTTHVDRGRTDGATRSGIRTKKILVERKCAALQLKFDWFKEDFILHNGIEQLTQLQLNLIDNYLLLGNYSAVKAQFEALKSIGKSAPAKYRLIYNLRLGWLYYFMLRTYLIVKYNIIKKII